MTEKITTMEEALKAVREDAQALEDVPENLITAELCLEACMTKIAVDEDDDYYDSGITALEFVPEELKTPQVCLAAIRQSDYAFHYLPKSFWTAQNSMEMVKHKGSYLAVVPENLKTAELCMEAVKSSDYALGFVPKKLRTEQLCQEAAKRDYYFLKDIPEAFRTAQICMDAVSRNGYELAYVPENLKTAELCRISVSQYANALKHVPDSYKTAELCEAAVKANAFMFKHVPDPLKTPQMCMDAVKANGRLLWYVPHEYRTAELCMAAVKSGSEAFNHVPEHLRTLELCVEAAQRNGKLEYMPSELIDEIRKRVLRLEDITRIDDASIAKAVSLVESHTLAKGLKLAETEVQEKVLRNMPERDAGMLKEDMEYMGPIRLKDAEDAARELCAVFLELEAKGEIELPQRGGEQSAASLKKPPTLGAVLKAALEQSLKSEKDADTASRIKTCLTLLDEKLPALVSRNYASSGGVEYITEVFSLVDNLDKPLELLTDENPELAEDFFRSTRVFADFVLLDDRSIQLLMREAASADLAAALIGEEEEVQEKVFRNMSKRASEMLKEDMERVMPIEADRAEEARQKILAIADRLEESGEILMSYYSGDQMVV